MAITPEEAEDRAFQDRMNIITKRIDWLENALTLHPLTPGEDRRTTAARLVLADFAIGAINHTLLRALQR